MTDMIVILSPDVMQVLLFNLFIIHFIFLTSFYRMKFLLINGQGTFLVGPDVRKFFQMCMFYRRHFARLTICSKFLLATNFWWWVVLINHELNYLFEFMMWWWCFMGIITSLSYCRVSMFELADVTLNALMVEILTQFRQKMMFSMRNSHV